MIYEKLRSGQLNLGIYLQTVMKAMPEWALELMDHFHLTTMAEVEGAPGQVRRAGQPVPSHQGGGRGLQHPAVRGRLRRDALSAVLPAARRLAAGRPHPRRPCRSDPMHKRMLAVKFTTVIRATVKGNIAVAAVQVRWAG